MLTVKNNRVVPQNKQNTLGLSLEINSRVGLCNIWGESLDYKRAVKQWNAGGLSSLAALY